MGFDGEDAFINGLKTTPDQKKVIDELFKEPEFLKIWNYLKNCRVTIKLKATPGLKIGGVERFGGYSPSTHTLEINPTKKEHHDNPQEKVDTLKHELIHAVLDLKDECGETDYPFDDDVLDAYHDPKLACKIHQGLDKSKVEGEAKEHLEKHYGDSASNPGNEYIDINDEAQRLIIKEIASLIKKTGVGKPTLTFENEKKRKGCFIATAAMGSATHPYVQSLRNFRDDILLQSRYSDTFEHMSQIYYRFSPPIANAMNESNKLRLFLRYVLVYPIVFSLWVIVPVINNILRIEHDLLKKEKNRTRSYNAV